MWLQTIFPYITEIRSRNSDTYSLVSASYDPSTGYAYLSCSNSEWIIGYFILLDNI